MRRSTKHHHNKRRTLNSVLLLTPALILVVTFYLVPMVLLVVMSFFNWPLLGQIRPNGFTNYERAFSDPRFADSVIFTFGYTLALVPISLFVSYVAAVLIRGNRRGSGFFRTSFFLPVAIGFTAAAYMASVLLTPGTGVINGIFRMLGLSDGNTAWFTNTTTAFWAVVAITVWKNMGVAMILLMAGMQSIDTDIYEAAAIDGAGWLRREWSLTLPLLRNSIALCLVLALSGTLLTFDQFYVLTKGGPAGSTITAVMFAYSESFMRYKLGYGAAISVLITLLILVIVAFQLGFLLKRRDRT